MSLFDSIMQQAGGLDLSAIGARVGLSPEQVQTGATELLPKIADPDVDNEDATAEVASNTGIPHSKLQALIPELLAQAQRSGVGGGMLGSIMAGLGGGGAPGEAGDQRVGEQEEGGGFLNNVAGMFGRK